MKAHERDIFSSSSSSSSSSSNSFILKLMYAIKKVALKLGIFMKEKNEDFPQKK